MPSTLFEVNLVPTVYRVTIARSWFTNPVTSIFDPEVSGSYTGPVVFNPPGNNTWPITLGRGTSTTENLGTLNPSTAYTCIKWSGTPKVNGNPQTKRTGVINGFAFHTLVHPAANECETAINHTLGDVSGSYYQFLMLDFTTAIEDLKNEYPEGNYFLVDGVFTGLDNFKRQDVDPTGNSLQMIDFFVQAYHNMWPATTVNIVPNTKNCSVSSATKDLSLPFSNQDVTVTVEFPVPGRDDIPPYKPVAVSVGGLATSFSTSYPCTGVSTYTSSFSFKVYLTEGNVNTYSGSGGGEEPTTDTEETKEQDNPGGAAETVDSGQVIGTYGGGSHATSGRGVPKDSSTFEYLYLPADIDITDKSGVIIGEGTIVTDDTGWFDGEERTIGLVIDNITLSLLEPDMMTFTQIDKFDADRWFNLNDVVFGVVYGNVVFRGHVVAVNPQINDKNQEIKYTVAGDRAVLNYLPWILKYRDSTGASVKTLVEKICNYTQSKFIRTYDTSAITAALNVYIPTIELGPTTVSEGLDQFLAYLGRFSYYIDTSRKLTIYDLKNLTPKEIYVPDEGELVSSSTKLLSATFAMDASACITRCVVIGDTAKTEHTGGREFNTEASWAEYKSSGYLLYLAGGKITGSVSAWVDEPNGTKTSVSVLKVDSLNGKIYLDWPSGWSAPWTLDPRVSVGQTKISILNAQTIHVQYVREGSNLMYDTGYVGTAYTTYGIQKTRVIESSNFKSISIKSAGQYQSDYGAMRAFAEATIDRVCKESWQGTVVLDGLDHTWTIGKCAYFSNTRAEWGVSAGEKMVVTSVSFDIAHLTTTLQLTTKCWLNTAVSDSTFLVNQKQRLEREKSRLKLEHLSNN